MATITTNSSTRDSIFANVRATIVTLVEDIKNRRMYRATQNELNALSARELDDLGIVRSEIPYAAHRAVYGL